MSGVLPGTYTETIYQGELATGSITVTINAGATTRQNIVDTNNYLEINPSDGTTISTPAISSPIFRIGTWDGTPLGFLNADKITNMHPTDVRMSPWTADSTGMTNFTVGVDPDSDFPMAEWHSQNGAAPFVDTTNQITFTLTAAQAATPLTLRIGVTRLDHGRPNISVNGHSSSTQNQTTQPSSRGLTTGNWRGNNSLYSFSIATSSLLTGTNTIDISCASGSTGTLFSGYHIYDAIDLVPTSSITNAPHVASITVTPANPTINTSEQRLFTAVAHDQFGALTPANFTWSSSVGAVDGTGSFIAPNAATSGTVTATSGSINGNTAVTIVTPVQIIGNVFNYQTAQSLSLTFNRAVDPTMLAGAISIENLTTQTTVPPASIHLNYSSTSGTFTFDGILANGNYLATIPAQTSLNASGDHFSTAYTFKFFVQSGDANHNGVVDASDFTLLAQNFNLTSATFGQGDFNYDGKVNALDFNLLASSFGQNVGGSGAVSLAHDAAVPTAPASGGLPPSLFSDASIETARDSVPSSLFD